MAFQPSIDPGKIRDLVSLEWVSSGENVVLIGPSGVGKTHLSIALGQLALQRGISVRFYPVIRLVEQLEKAYKAGTIDDKIREVNKPKLLILDELGFIPFTPLQGQLLFELISARYEKKSIIVTSNKMPGEWGTVFGDAQLQLRRWIGYSITARPCSFRAKAIGHESLPGRCVNKGGRNLYSPEGC